MCQIFVYNQWVSLKDVSLGFILLGTSCFFIAQWATLQYTMPDSDEKVQRQVEEIFGFKPCLWQIGVVCVVLVGEDVITVAPTRSSKSLTYISMSNLKSYAKRKNNQQLCC